LIASPPRTRSPAQPVCGVAPRWIAPSGDYAKINVDAAVSRSENRGVVAAICRSSDGSYLGASALACPGISDPGTLEAIACREGLALAADLQLSRFLLSTDCLEVIKAMRNNYLPRSLSSSLTRRKSGN
jgi:ribonuclease HI